MPSLIAAVVVVGVLCLFNLLLMYGVIRRLGEHTELLAKRPALPDIIAGSGEVVGTFTAATVEGDELVADDLLPGTLVGFFSPGCSACVEELPKFVDAAAAHPSGVLAVVVGPESESGDQVRALSPKARVVVTSHGAEIVKAFAVQGYPGFALVGNARRVTASGALTAVAAAAQTIA